MTKVRTAFPSFLLIALATVLSCSERQSPTLEVKKSAAVSLVPGDSKSEVSYAGSLMIDSIGDELAAAGYSASLVEQIVTQAQTEVSLAATLAFGTLDEISLNLNATDSSDNVTVGIAAEAVARGSITALRSGSESALNEETSSESVFFALASGVKYLNELTGYPLLHDSIFTLAANIPTVDTVGLIAKAQIKGISSIKSEGKINGLSTDAIASTTQRMTSSLFTASSQIGLANDATVEELAGNVMRSIINAVASSELKSDAAGIITKIPNSVEGFKTLRLDADLLSATSKTIVQECVTGINVAQLQTDAKDLVVKIVTASVTGVYAAAATTESMASAASTVAKTAFVSYNNLSGPTDVSVQTEAARTMFSSAILAFDTLQGWNLEVITAVTSSMRSKAVEATQEVGLTGDNGASMVASVSIGIFDSIATMPTIEKLGTDNTAIQTKINELSNAAIADIQNKFPDAKADYTTAITKAAQNVTTDQTNTAPTDLTLSNQILAENSGLNAVIGNLSAIDPNSADTFTYTLVAGTGSTDNASFNILGSQLRMTTSGDFESKSLHEVRIKVADQSGLSFEKKFTITIANVNESPNFAAIADQTTLEDTAVTIALSPSDTDGNLSCTSANFLYSSSNPSVVAESGAISWSGTWPSCAAIITPVSNNSGSSSLTITVTDGSLTASRSFTLTVSAVNDLPFVSNISPVLSEEDSPNVIAVPIVDDTPSLSCSQAISATSSNQTLLPNSSISAVGTLPDCQITYTPGANQSGSTDITLTISDGELAVTKTITVSVTAVNDPPTISDVGNQTTKKDAVLGNVAVSIADPDSTFSCNSITASSTNTTLIPSGNVTISGVLPNCLISISPLAGQVGLSTITLTVSDGSLTASDSFVLTVTQFNSAPSDLLLSSVSLAENSGVNSVVGSLSATDRDNGDTFTYSLVAGSGSTDNASFNIQGSQLRMTASADFETQSSYTVRIKVADQDGFFFEKQFPISITNVNENPSLAAIESQTTLEDTAVTIPLSPSDPDGNLSCTSTNFLYSSSDPSVVAATGAVTWSGNWPNCSALISPVFNHSGSSSLTITVTDGSLTESLTFNLTVTAVNDPPVISDVPDQITNQDIVLSGISVSISDSDSDSTLTCNSITPSSSNTTLIPSGNVTLSGVLPNCLVSLSPVIDQSGSSTITLTVSDGYSSALDTFVLTVNHVNSAPTDLSLSSLTLAENSGENAVVGTLSATDPDTGDPFTYSLATGTGSTDNASFTVLGNQLRLTASADFETKSYYSILLRATDQGGLYFEKAFTVIITNINDAPSLSAISNQTINQYTTSAAISLAITDVDGPNGTCNATYLSYTSQSTSVIASTGAVSWAGAWPNCTAVITPVNGATGSSLISISVSDGLLTSVPQSFSLQVGSAPIGWYQEAYLKASNSASSDNFGFSVSISGDKAIVGAPNEDSNQTTITNSTTASLDNSKPESGAGYIYRRTGATWAQESYIKASNADGPISTENLGDNFGLWSSISGDTAIVGAINEDSSQTVITNGTTSSADNSLSSAGASYIYRRSGTTWAQEAYLKASNPGAWDYFGSAVSISGDTAIVGAWGESSGQTTITNGSSSSTENSAVGAGASYIYRRSGNLWRQEAYAKASNADGSDRFGYAVSLSGDTAIVGATWERSTQTSITNGTGGGLDNTAQNVGAAYIYRRIGTTWIQEAYLKASNANADDYFGSSVSVSGETAIVGAYGEASTQNVITDGSGGSMDNSAAHTGASYIFRRSGSTWAPEAYIKASNADGGDQFGNTVSISGDTAIVGAYTESSTQTTIINGTTSSIDNNASAAGASYIYRRSGATWVQEAYLKASNTNGGDQFAYAVSVSGDTAVVGAKGEASIQTVITNGTTSSADNSAGYAGAVYVYRNRSRMFNPSEVGSAVTTSSFTLSWNGSNLGSGFGAVKVVYSTTTPYPNCSSGTVAYSGTASSVSVTSGLIPGQSYVARICTFDGVNYSEGVTTGFTVKGDDIGPTVLSITRGTTPNPVPWGTTRIDYKVTFDEPVFNLNPQNFSLTEATANTPAAGQIENISCTGTVCTVWVVPDPMTQYQSPISLQIRLDLTISAGIVDTWGNPLSSLRNGDESYSLTTYSASTGGQPTGWVQEAYLKASNAGNADYFGTAVSVSGDTAIVGANGEDSIQTTITPGTTLSTDNQALDAGASYIYRRSGTIWVQEAYLKASNANSSDYFGTAVSVSGDTAIVGANGESSIQTTITNGTTSSLDNALAFAGASYIYRRIGNTWAQEAYVKASNANVGDYFGTAVSVSGDTAIVGAKSEDSIQTTITNGMISSQDNSLIEAGASYIYKRTGSSWVQEAYVKASNANAGDNFGTAVSVSGDTAIVGAKGEDSIQTTITNGITSSTDNQALDAGSSYIYRRSGTIWVQEAYVKASNANAGDNFGTAVSVSGDTAIVGANVENSIQTTITPGTTLNKDNLALDAGASYIYRRSGTTWAQEAYLKASNTGNIDYFGTAVSVSGDTAIVGANGEDSIQTTITPGTTSNTDNQALDAGASYIYRRSGTIWVQEAYIKPSNAHAFEKFGSSVSLSGDTAIVGAYGEKSNQTTITIGPTSSPDQTLQDAGAVFVYRNSSRIFDPDLRVSAKTPNSITLSWGINLGSASQVKIAPAASGTVTPLPCTDANAITLAAGAIPYTYTYSGLTTGTKYGFRVCGFDGTNVGDGSVIWERTN